MTIRKIGDVIKPYSPSLDVERRKWTGETPRGAIVRQAHQAKHDAATDVIRVQGEASQRVFGKRKASFCA